MLISIHATAWGATSFDTLNAGRQSNFNPRPRMGSDRPFRADPRYKYHFNPRPRMGSDEDQPLQSDVDYISIHAPAWGATREQCQVFETS